MVESKLISHDEIRVLRNVVELFIETGEPVSSRMIKSRYRIAESTAYIRGILHRLEELGLLFKPHVSAGRVPTDHGYRRYVDEMGVSNALERSLAEKVRRRIGQDWSDVRDVMAITSQLLGDLTSYMGLSMGVVHAQSAVERLEIVRLERRGGLVVLTLVPGTVRKVFVEFAKDYPAYVVEGAVRMINERIAGHPLESAPERLEAFLKEAPDSEREIVEAVSREAEYLFDWPYDFNYFYRGGARRGVPQLASPRMLESLVRLMGERSIMVNVLRGRLAADVSITIGSENRVRELEDFAIVTRRFRSKGCEGLLGVLGPTRMSYRLVLSLLDATAEELTNVRIAAQ